MREYSNEECEDRCHLWADMADADRDEQERCARECGDEDCEDDCDDE